MICLSLPLRMYSYTRFTSSAFVFKPFPVSPRHFSQNLSSELFNSSGFRPSREAPGISFSVRGITFESLELSDGLAIFSACGRACVVNNKRRDATLAFLASFSHRSNQVSRLVFAIMKVVYTWFHTKMGSVYFFRPKRPKNPTRWGGMYLYGLNKGVPPLPGLYQVLSLFFTWHQSIGHFFKRYFTKVKKNTWRS